MVTLLAVVIAAVSLIGGLFLFALGLRLKKLQPADGSGNGPDVISAVPIGLGAAGILVALVIITSPLYI